MASAQSQGTTVLDPSAINTLRELSSGTHEGFINEFVALYLRNADVLVEEIRQYAEDWESGALRAAAHKLRGSSLNIGALQVAEICGRLEMKGKKKQQDGSMELVESLAVAYLALREELAALRE